MTVSMQFDECESDAQLHQPCIAALQLQRRPGAAGRRATGRATCDAAALASTS
eukprot:SAG25_NODE_1696_length_2529_cov_3.835391_1_plen_53_part_00